jgi:hypothetical protein
VASLCAEDRLLAELRELNEYLEKRYKQGGTTAERRGRAAEKGVFAPLSALQGEEISSFFQGRALAGIDGSMTTEGASYPYQLTFFRALALLTAAGSNKQSIWAEEIFSPLLPRYRSKIEEQLGGGRGTEETMAHLRWETLARLEAEVARRAAALRPRLLVLDGGFGRLKEHTPHIWSDLKGAALEDDVLLLGVTEEIAASSLAEKLCPPDKAAASPGLMGDREVLFGLLRPGETYRLHEEESGDRGRLYVRFAAHPQVVAVDYLKGQESGLEPALNFLYSITPSHGRGFPLWLDVVDAEVRLRREEVEAMIASSLQPAMAEVFLRPLRASREL